MTNEHFEAILAKNAIARGIREYKNAPVGEGEPLSIYQLIENLRAIEGFIGQGNQPSIEDIIESEYCMTCGLKHK